VSEHQSTWEQLNELARIYSPLADAADVAFTFLIGIGLVMIARQANRIAKSNVKLAEERSRDRGWAIKSDERATFKSNYEKVSNALGLTMRDGTVAGEARALIWQARDDARLELPKEISDYTENLFSRMNDAYRTELLLSNSASLSDEKRNGLTDKNHEIMMVLIEEKPFLVYEKYLKFKVD